MKPIFVLFSLSLYIAINAQPRFTDSTFGNNGKVIENTSLPRKSVVDLLLQPDSKSITLAKAEYDGKHRVVLIRYTTNGTLDSSFSSDGIADSLITPGVDCHSSTIKMQPDGKLLVSGYTKEYPATTRLFVIRYNSNGSLDGAFATNGILFLPTDQIFGLSDQVTGISDLTVLPNSKLMLMTSLYTDSTDFSLVQLNSNGRIDSSFGINGVIRIDGCPPPYQVGYTRILQQTDGKLVIGGQVYYYSGTSPAAILVRVNPNGIIDNTYGTNGYLFLYPGNAAANFFRDMAIQADNKIVVSGISGGYDYTYFLRTTINGAADASFGNNGKQYLQYGSKGFRSIDGQISLQQDSKILLAGTAGLAGSLPKMAVARLTTTGIMDAGFSGDGIAVLPINQHASYGAALAQQADGRIIVNGIANENNKASAGIARLTINGQIDNTIATVSNIAYIGSGHYYEEGENVLVQPADQKIIDVKHRFNGISYDVRVSRFLPTGQPDSAYGINGHTIVEMASKYLYSTSSLQSQITSNGKLVIVKHVSDYAGKARIEIIRLNSNGRIDSTFGTNGRMIVAAGNNPALGSRLVDVTFLNNDKVVLLTNQPIPTNGNDSTFLVQLNPDGSLDAGFGTNGRKYLGTTGSSGFGKVAAQSSNKIILPEGRFNSSPPQVVINRYNTNGTIDNSFNGGNISVTPVSPQSMVVQPDDKIVFTNYINEFFRLNSTGSPDSSFGVNGFVDDTTYPANDMFYTSLVAADSGKLLVIGNLDYTQPTDSAFVQVVRFKNNGRPDSTFGTNGVVKVFKLEEVAMDSKVLAVQSDNTLVLTGIGAFDALSPDYGNAVLTRLKSNNAIGRRYTFTGNGLWSNPANWSEGTVPPTTIPAGSSIVIDPPTGGECVIDITVHVQTGASVTLKAGKRVRLPGNLIIQ